MFTIVHPLALVASALWVRLRGNRRRGPIALPPDEEDGANPRRSQTRGAREVDAEALWG